MAESIVIVSAARTPIGGMLGDFSALAAHQLGSVAIKAAIERAGVPGDAVDEVLMGNCLMAGQGQAPARQAALGAGLPQSAGAVTLSKMCGSGMRAMMFAHDMLRAESADVVVAGGMESMSGAPYLLKKARFGVRMGHDQLIDSMIADGLTCPITLVHMGITAENIAAKYGISREEQDEFAAESQQKATAAIQGGHFKDEIVPVEVAGAKKGETFRFEVDEHPRAGTTAEKLKPLRAAFKPDGGTVTAGNASGINDGGAAVVIMSDCKAKELGLTPLATIRSYASAGVDPSIMGMGPWPASEKALERAGLRKEEIDLWELNEAFAAQSLGVQRELKLPKNRVNVNGGAIALGHPIGASGARVLVTLLHAMAARDARLGVASLCIGGGQGIAMVVERG
ncbi:MAG TPA: acetyl-CoA C-acetyltransferase [Caldimonas sp.]|nr:acetyl-CoA C-acetyltransferase [Caldimonas sp.]